MTTSEELWAEGERRWYVAVDRVADDVAERVDAAVLFELALKSHESASREVETALSAMNMAIRRLQRARRHSRRAALTLWRAARLCAMRRVGSLTERMNEELRRADA